MVPEKKCPQCDRTLPASSFHKDRRTATGLRSYCKSCVKDRFQTQFKNGPHYKNRLKKYAAQRKDIRAADPARVWAFDTYHNAKKRAKAAGLPFDLTKEWLLEQLGDKCPLLDTPYVLGNGKTCSQTPTLDRKKPGAGYTTDNCWVVSAKANRIKSDASVEEIRLLVSNLERLGI